MFEAPKVLDLFFKVALLKYIKNLALPCMPWQEIIQINRIKKMKMNLNTAILLKAFFELFSSNVSLTFRAASFIKIDTSNWLRVRCARFFQ